MPINVCTLNINIIKNFLVTRYFLQQRGIWTGVSALRLTPAVLFCYLPECLCLPINSWLRVGEGYLIGGWNEQEGVVLDFLLAV